MSKAFTKEDDDVSEVPTRRRGVPVPELNVVTPDGLRAARAELDALGNRDPDRARELVDHLATARAMPPEDLEIIGLGAHVTVQDDNGKRTTYRIVGAIEADAKNNFISYLSPLAQALWGARIGETRPLPRGDAEIVGLRY